MSSRAQRANKRAPASGRITLGFRPTRKPGESDVEWFARGARSVAQSIAAMPNVLDDLPTLRRNLAECVGWHAAIAEGGIALLDRWELKAGPFHLAGRNYRNAADLALLAAQRLGVAAYGPRCSTDPREAPDLRAATLGALGRFPGICDAIVAAVEREVRLALGEEGSPPTEEARAAALWVKLTARQRQLWRRVAQGPGETQTRLVGGNVSDGHRADFKRLVELGAIEQLGKRSGYAAKIQPPSEESR